MLQENEKKKKQLSSSLDACQDGKVGNFLFLNGGPAEKERRKTTIKNNISEPRQRIKPALNPVRDWIYFLFYRVSLFLLSFSLSLYLSRVPTPAKLEKKERKKRKIVAVTSLLLHNISSSSSNERKIEIPSDWYPKGRRGEEKDGFVTSGGAGGSVNVNFTLP